MGDIHKRPWEIGFRVGYFADVSPAVQADYLTNELNVTADESLPNTFIDGSEVSIAESYSGLTVQPAVSFGGSAKKLINIDFTLGRYISNRFTLNSGLNFTRTTYLTDYASYEKINANTKITSIAVPIGFGFDAIKRRAFKLRMGAVFNSEFSAYENEISVYNIGPNTSSNGFTRGFSTALDFSIQSHIRLQRGVFLTISPTYRKYLSQNVRAENLLVEKNNWLGGTIGVIWSL
jgi:hypothetical protein